MAAAGPKDSANAGMEPRPVLDVHGDVLAPHHIERPIPIRQMRNISQTQLRPVPHQLIATLQPQQIVIATIHPIRQTRQPLPLVVLNAISNRSRFIVKLGGGLHKEAAAFQIAVVYPAEPIFEQLANTRLSSFGLERGADHFAAKRVGSVFKHLNLDTCSIERLRSSQTLIK